jgi:hypothetical protein
MMIGTRRAVSGRGAAAADLDAGEMRQHPVEQDEVGLVLAQMQRLLAVVRLGDAEALALEIVAQQADQRGLVLDDQDACGFMAAASSRQRLGVGSLFRVTGFDLDIESCRALGPALGEGGR